MKLPRDLSGARLIRALAKLGYTQQRQTGSHVRLTTTIRGVHHLTVPLHDPLRSGTLAALVSDIADHHGLTRDEVISILTR